MGCGQTKEKISHDVRAASAIRKIRGSRRPSGEPSAEMGGSAILLTK